MEAFAFLHSGIHSLPPLAKFALGMAIIVCIPPFSRRVGLPAVVGLLLSGVVVGPHVLGIFGEQRPIVDFLSDLGKLLLMFGAGLEIDLVHFRQVQGRAILFGVITTAVPLLLGTVVGLVFDYGVIAALVVGSLLASHTLLGSSILAQLGANRLEPVTVTVGATVLSDILSLIVFAICVSTYERGFSTFGIAVQILEIALFVPFILLGLSRVGAYALTRVETEENVYFVLMFGIMAVAGVLASTIHLPDIVGAFLAGLAVNAAVHDKPAKEKLEFFGNSFFIPIFFIATGFLIDPLVFVRSILDNFSLTAAIIVALVAGKWLAADIAGRVFTYTPAARLTMWSLTLPQVAATLAAALVAFHTVDPLGHHLIDSRMLNVVLVLMLTTATLGPILTQHFAPRMFKELSVPEALEGVGKPSTTE
jgi:Kef-type K+ transport system membrane component KefB